MTCGFDSMRAGLRVVLGALLVLALAPTVTAVDLDKDDDGLTDAMEQGIAERFFPNLWLSNLLDRASFYGCDADTEANVPYTVEDVWYAAEGLSGLACMFPGECILLKIGLPYHRDFGDSGGAHQGDSEHYMALLSRLNIDRTIVKKNSDSQVCTVDRSRDDAECWWVVVDWTSAHHGGGLAESSYHAVIAHQLHAIGDGSARTVYASERKHANYHTDEGCDEGGLLGADDCKPRYNVRDTCFFTLQNVGNSPVLDGDGMGDGYDSFIRYPETTGNLYDIWGGLGFGGASPYLSKFNVNGSYLWPLWYKCVFARTVTERAVYCGSWNLECESNDSCTCNDLCSPNRDYLACGNGVCSPGETCSSCAADCGTCPGGGGGGGGGGGAVCGNGLCESGESCETGGGSGQCQPDCGCCDGWTAVCFVAGTPVTMADGSQRAIEEIAVGDRVLAYDEEQGRVVPSVVSRTYSNPGSRETLIRVNGSVVATGSHPFYTQRGIVSAGDLQPGDRLLALGALPGASPTATALQDLPVSTIETLTPADVVYNLEVGGEHNFFAGGLLVHNKTATGGCEPDEPMF